MSNENFRRELNSVFDEMSGSPSPELRDRVRGAVADAPPARGGYVLAGVAAAVIATLLVGVLVIAGPLRRVPLPAGIGVTQAPSPSPTPSPGNPPQSYACTDQDFIFDKTSSAPPVAFISALRTGSHGSYDRVTIEFGNSVPNDVQISAPVSGATFTTSPKGESVALKGTHGILVTIHGADLHTSYSGSTDLVTGYSTLAEVRRVQDFEGVVQFGLGVNGTGCYRASWLSGPDRLVIDVQTAS